MIGNCAICGHGLIWQSDFTLEDYCYVGEGFVGVYSCSNEDCGATVEFIVADKKMEETKMKRYFSVVKDEKRKHPEVVIGKPTRGSKFSAGYDIRIPVKVALAPNEKRLVWTDTKAYMNEDEVLKIYPRSGLATKKGIIITNIVPIIDADYAYTENDGNIGISLWNNSEQLVVLEAGERVAQGIFQHYLITDDDETEDERSGCFGSTGTK